MNSQKSLLLLSAAGLFLAGCSSCKQPSSARETCQNPMATGSGAPVMAHASDMDLESFRKAASDRVFFEYNKNDLTPAAHEVLNQQASWLMAHPHASVVIEGYCDERGTEEYNLALGERRANAVKTYLEVAGVDSSRITIISYGKSKVLFPGHDEAAWAQNRAAITTLGSCK